MFRGKPICKGLYLKKGKKITLNNKTQYTLKKLGKDLTKPKLAEIRGAKD